jgi:Holliday junction resolvase-like predicted endonuclease
MLKAEKKYNIIGSYWDGKNQNEIDIVAINELEKIVLFADVKRNKNNINLRYSPFLGQLYIRVKI